MIAFALLSVAATAVDPAPVQAAKPETVFACEFFRTEREASDGWVHHVDVRIVQRSDGLWTIETAEHALTTAKPFRVQFGSVGRSLGLRWKDSNGSDKTAYILFSDQALSKGIEYFWLSFGHPSLWKTPGYGCMSDDARGARA